MRLPRRVPWGQVNDLEQVCSWIFTDENDIESKILAVNRLSAWKTVTTLPHALEATLSILTVIIQDHKSQSSLSSLYLRQSYATAIIRLVNGLVDPLQSGAYARSIASIATQLGLPLWLVELRHAATHEDLPSLEVLKMSARESMAWLLRSYFLPALNPSAPSQAQSTALRPLAPILKLYKSLLKITSRDTSLQKQYKAEIQAVQRDIERWVAEGKVAAKIIVGDLGWDSRTSFDTLEDDHKERWALERLCDGLLEKGALVPLSKKKRVFSDKSFLPPQSLLALWTPLLTHLHSNHPLLPSVLIHHIITTIAPSDAQSVNQQVEISRPDISFDMCLARWAFWIIGNSSEVDVKFDLKRDATVLLFTMLGPGSSHLTGDRKAALALLETLCDGDEDLQKVRSLLFSTTTSYQTTSTWDAAAFAEMDQRLNTLLSIGPEDELVSSTKQSPQPNPQHIPNDVSLPGWRLLDSTTSWKPCPIGVFVDV